MAANLLLPAQRKWPLSPVLAHLQAASIVVSPPLCGFSQVHGEANTRNDRAKLMKLNQIPRSLRVRAGSSGERGYAEDASLKVVWFSCSHLENGTLFGPRIAYAGARVRGDHGRENYHSTRERLALIERFRAADPRMRNQLFKRPVSGAERSRSI